jgi:hypothetical protein
VKNIKNTLLLFIDGLVVNDSQKHEPIYVKKTLPNKAALDAGNSAARFASSIFLTSSFFCIQAEFTPAPAPIKKTVGAVP